MTSESVPLLYHAPVVMRRDHVFPKTTVTFGRLIHMLDAQQNEAIENSRVMAIYDRNKDCMIKTSTLPAATSCACTYGGLFTYLHALGYYITSGGALLLCGPAITAGAIGCACGLCAACCCTQIGCKTLQVQKAKETQETVACLKQLDINDNTVLDGNTLRKATYAVTFDETSRRSLLESMPIMQLYEISKALEEPQFTQFSNDIFDEKTKSCLNLLNQPPQDCNEMKIALVRLQAHLKAESDFRECIRNNLSEEQQSDPYIQYLLDQLKSSDSPALQVSVVDNGTVHTYFANGMIIA